jgi:hypothetical protein
MTDDGMTITLNGVVYQVGYEFVSVPAQFEPLPTTKPAWESGKAMCSCEQRGDDDDPT